MPKIDSFRGKYYFLSNFYPAQLTYNEVTYLNAEAAFQAQKVFSKEEQLLFANLLPSEAKRLGRRVNLRPDWDRVKDQIMYEVVKAKFEQNPDLRAKLLATGYVYLEEGNTWGDRYWGVDANGVGLNKLGHILMQVRRELQTY